MRGKEAFNQRGLADAGLAINQSNAAETLRCIVQAIAKSPQRLVALEELHHARPCRCRLIIPVSPAGSPRITS
jgi:hypothetical protein